MTHNSIDLTVEDGPHWPPKEFRGVKWLPVKPLPWAWLVGPAILFLTGTILLALVLSLPMRAGGV